MNVLLLYPVFEKSFWSFEKSLAILGKKAFMPPLGLITIAAMMPDQWEYRLVDQNVRQETDDDWDWADIVMISGMISQRKDFFDLIAAAKLRQKKTIVGGPYVSSCPELFQQAGADYIVTGEGDITIPLLMAALKNKQPGGVISAQGEKPDVTTTPVPRYELLEMDAYSVMPVQYSRGCPFNCEFCDIIVLYGRKTRTKTPEQMLAELQYLYDLGWREMIFIVDDNFIGNKKQAKKMLTALKPWLIEKRYPFSFNTEASVNLAEDQALMDLMVACNFGSVFIGIETPDRESLEVTGKVQNMKDPLLDSVRKIMDSGIRIMAGFIIGFDGEQKGAGRRVRDFVEASAIPIAAFSMLQALPGTALEKRLKREGRLLEKPGDLNYTTLLNYIPSRPVEDIAEEFIQTFWDLYDPKKYVARVYRCYRILGEVDWPKKERAAKKLGFKEIKAALTLFWVVGFKHPTRTRFWPALFSILRHNPGGLISFLSVLGQVEHFIAYRKMIKKQIGEQLKQMQQYASAA